MPCFPSRRPAMLADTRGRLLRDLRISVTDRCNFRCVYCMPKEVFGRDYPFLPHVGAADLRGDRAARAHLQGARRREDPPDRRRAAAAQEPRAPGRDARRHRRPRSHPDHQRRAARQKGARAQGCRAQSRHGEPRRAGRRRVPRHERRRLSGRARARRHRRRRSRGTGAGQGQHGGQARRQRRSRSCRWRGTSAAAGTSCASSSTWTSATPTAGAWTTWCRRRRSCASSGASFRWQPVDANYPGEVAERWRYTGSGNAGEIGVISSVTQAFCSDCTRARLATDGKLYTCLFATQGYDLRALLRERQLRRRDRQLPRGDLVAARRPLFRDPLGEHERAAQDRDELHRRLSSRRRNRPARSRRDNAACTSKRCIEFLKGSSRTTTGRGSPGTSRRTTCCARSSSCWSATSPLRVRQIRSRRSGRSTRRRRCSASIATRAFPRTSTPYKTHFSAAIRDRAKRGLEPGYYFHIDHQGMLLVGGGIYRPEPGILKRVRAYIAARPETLTRMLRDAALPPEPTAVSSTKTRWCGRPRDSAPTRRTSRRSSCGTIFGMNEVNLKRRPPKDLAADLAAYFRDLLPMMEWLRIAAAEAAAVNAPTRAYRPAADRRRAAVDLQRALRSTRTATRATRRSPASIP